MEIIKQSSHFTDGVQKTKVLTQLVNKKVPVGKLVLQNTLVFLVKAHFKPVLGDSSEIGYYEIDFCNVCIELYKIITEVETILKQEIIKLVRLSTAKSVGDVGFCFT